MKPHTRIIYYTLLCQALNHQRSRALIWKSIVCVFVYILICNTSMCMFVCMQTCVHVFLWCMNRKFELITKKLFIELFNNVTAKSINSIFALPVES